ncbi:MAG TPA: metal-dependent phosphohydrolase [Propionibacteriaceae bacterium]|nr:metal-dependent phosphohydrolase [Propionibacteriaceae bacterium]
MAVSPDESVAPLRELRARWSALLPDADPLFEELVSRWGADDRHYHDLRHLAEALAALDTLGGRPLERLALWFHDAVYGLGPGADERASAQLAVDRLPEHGLPQPDVDEVRRLVLVTEHHSPAPGDLPAARVSDADMAILASDPGRYADSVRGIRAEYAHYDDEAFRRGRVAVLRDFLARDRIFHTPTGLDRWERPARRNIADELRWRDVAG